MMLWSSIMSCVGAAPDRRVDGTPGSDCTEDGLKGPWADVYLEERGLAGLTNATSGLCLDRDTLKKSVDPLLAISWGGNLRSRPWIFVLWPTSNSRFTVRGGESIPSLWVSYLIRSRDLSSSDYSALAKLGDQIRLEADVQPDNLFGLDYDCGSTLRVWVADPDGGVHRARFAAPPDADLPPAWSMMRSAVEIVLRNHPEAQWPNP